MSSRSIPVSHLEGAAASAVRRARAGEQVVITSRGDVVAVLGPPQTAADMEAPIRMPTAPGPIGRGRKRIRLSGGPTMAETVVAQRR